MSKQFYVVAQRSRINFGYCYLSHGINRHNSNWTKSIKKAFWFGSFEEAKIEVLKFKFNKPCVFRFNFIQEQDRIKHKSIQKVFEKVL